MAGSQVTVAASCIEKQRLGYQAISLTNFASDTLEPAIAAGSKVEIGGALYEFASDEALTGWSGIANSSDVYIHLTVSGSSVTASFSTTAPTWDDAKQGWYSGAVRVIGGLYKDGSGNYARKWLYEEKQVASVKRYGNGTVEFTGALYGAVEVDGSLSVSTTVTGGTGMVAGTGNQAFLKAKVSIGVWNMDADATKVVALPMDGNRVRVIGGVIYSDDYESVAEGCYIFPTRAANGSPECWVGPEDLMDDSITLYRQTGGMFDSTDFNATDMSRGELMIEYLP